MINHAREVFIGWKLAKDKMTKQRIKFASSQSVSCHAPLEGVLKCNIDAVFFDNHGMSSFGMCLHDHRGYFVQARTAWMTPKLLAHEGETAALLQAIQWTTVIGADKVIFEVDIKKVGDEVYNFMENLTKFGSIVTLCKELLCSFPNYEVKFIRR